MPSESLDVLLSSGIIFVLYNLCYVGQIDNLKIHAGLIIPNGGSNHETTTYGSRPTSWYLTNKVFMENSR
jgi:hypothetical protein